MRTCRTKQSQICIGKLKNVGDLLLKVILKMEAPNPIENAIKWSNCWHYLTKDNLESRITLLVGMLLEIQVFF